MEDRLAHRPEEDTRANTPLETHREPLPHRVFRLRACPADHHIARLGKSEAENQQYQDKREEHKPPSEVVTHPIEPSIED